MSNLPNDHSSIRVHAPPGGRSNNIFGSNSDEPHTKPTTLAGQYKQTQMKSNIFGTDDSAPSRHVSNKNKSNIFGTDNDDDQSKKHPGVRQGLRDPNASRMGYNPINGESYSTKDNLNSKVDTTEKPADVPADTAQQENATVQETSTTSTENSNTKAPTDNTKDTNNAQKSVHTSVRVFHPPGGKSSGPLW